MTRAGESKLRRIAETLKGQIDRRSVYGLVDGMWRRIFDAKYRRKDGRLIAWVTDGDNMKWLPITGECSHDNGDIILNAGDVPGAKDFPQRFAEATI